MLRNFKPAFSAFSFSGSKLPGTWIRKRGGDETPRTTLSSHRDEWEWLLALWRAADNLDHAMPDDHPVSPDPRSTPLHSHYRHHWPPKSPSFESLAAEFESQIRNSFRNIPTYGRQDDDRAPRWAHPSLRDYRDRKRVLVMVVQVAHRLSSRQVRLAAQRARR
jgi:hypothetical protein